MGKMGMFAVCGRVVVSVVVRFMFVGEEMFVDDWHYGLMVHWSIFLLDLLLPSGIKQLSQKWSS